MTKEAKKYHLIEEIIQIEDDLLLNKFEELLREYKESMNSIRHLVKPVRKKTDVDQLVKEQGYKGIEKGELDQIIEEIAIEEPIEDLLEMI